MMGSCTLAMLWHLSGMPAGTVITVPASSLNGYTPAQIRQAKACARERGIRWRIADDK